jgi:hypothetical protein
MACLRVEIHTNNVALFRCISIHSPKISLLQSMTDHIPQTRKPQHNP